MLYRTVSYRSLLRVIGGCFLLYGLYVIALVLTAQIDVGGSIQYSGLLIFEGPIDIRNYLFCGGPFLGNPLLPLPVLPIGFFLTPGPFFWVSLGMLCLSFASTHVKVMYVCLQIALWLISLSLWFPIFNLLGYTDFTPERFVPLALITLFCSLILLACYKPVTHFLSRFFGPNRAMPIVKA